MSENICVLGDYQRDLARNLMRESKDFADSTLEVVDRTSEAAGHREGSCVLPGGRFSVAAGPGLVLGPEGSAVIQAHTLRGEKFVPSFSCDPCCPTDVLMVYAMLRTPSGLVLKQEPRAPWWAGNERNIA